MDSFISIIKKYTLLIGVIAASVVLAIVFLVQKGGDDSTVTPGKSSLSTNTTPETIQPATFATDSSGNKIVPTTTSALDTPDPSEVVQDATEPTDSGNTEAQFTTVDDNYFYDALFIGNSRTVGLSMFGSMPKETTFYATVGMNIYDLMTSSAQVPPEEGPEQSFSSVISGNQYGKIYIMLGINDLGTGTSESFTEYYKSVIDQIHQQQPNAIIYIQSIINISAERDAQGDAISNANINEKNALLKQLANNDYIYYLDVNEVLIDSNGYLNADYTSDGIHLGGGSLSLWEDYLYSHAIIK